MKILYIVNTDWYFHLHWLTRAQHARAMGFEVHLLVPHKDDKILADLREQGFILHDIKMPRASLNIVGEWKILRRIWQVVGEVKPDLVHTITIKPNLYAGIVARIRKIPIISSIVGLGVLFSTKSIKYSFIKQGVRLLFRYSSGNPLFIGLCENNDDIASLEQLGAVPRNKLVKVPGAGVDIDAFQVTPAPEAQCIRVVFASRLLREKGVYDLVDAAKHFAEENAPIKFSFAGIIDQDAPGAISEDVVEQLDCDGVIEWLGQVKDIPKLISDSHIVCLPSTYGEGIPRILIEAAACGRPIVTTDVPGCREICQHNKNGLLIPPGSLSSLVQALETLSSSDSLRDAMGHVGREMVENEYSNQHVIAQLESLYQNSVRH